MLHYITLHVILHINILKTMIKIEKNISKLLHINIARLNKLEVFLSKASVQRYDFQIYSYIKLNIFIHQINFYFEQCQTKSIMDTHIFYANHIYINIITMLAMILRYTYIND